MTQAPSESSVSVAPLTVHTVGVELVKATGNPDVAVAVSGGGVALSAMSTIEAKLIDCADRPTAIVAVTWVTAA